jgi:hypothetical protein
MTVETVKENVTVYFDT